MKPVVKKLIFILLPLVSIGFLIAYWVNQPVDIRNKVAKEGITKASKAEGMALLDQMETAHGGRSNWDSLQFGEFIQQADWYGKLAMSHWDTTPQRYQMVSFIGSEACEMQLLNGENTQTIFKLQDGQLLESTDRQTWTHSQHPHFKEKMIFKTYWFQFPFRIGEASIISAAGQSEINGQPYDLVYATWGKEDANIIYDQFMLYLDAETHLLTYLEFTVRDKFKPAKITAHFNDFRSVDGFKLAFAQYVTSGAPGESGIPLHENLYEEVRLVKR